MSNSSHFSCNCAFGSVIVNITGVILHDFRNVNSSFLHEQFISPSPEGKLLHLTSKKLFFTKHEGTMNNLRHTQGKYVIKALNTKPQCDSRHGSVLFSMLAFPEVKLLLTALWRADTIWKMLPIA